MHRAADNEYGREYAKAHKQEIKAKQEAYYQSHPEKLVALKEWRKRYCVSHRDMWRRSARASYWRMKERVMKLVSGKAECVVSGCGCDDIRLLELNYKKGGHNSLWKSGKLSRGPRLYGDIQGGRVNPMLFEVMCKAHNAIDHMEKKFGVKWKISKFEHRMSVS